MNKGFIYSVDVYIRDGKVIRFHHRYPAGVNPKFGKITDLPGFRHFRFRSTRECYLSYLKEYKFWMYCWQFNE